MLSPLLGCPIRDSWQTWKDHVSNLVNWATAVVGAGVALEAVEPIHDLVCWIKRKKIESIQCKELAEFAPQPQRTLKSEYRSPDHPPWLKWFGRIGIIAVVIGVVGEWRCGATLEDANNALHKIDVIQATGAQAQAQDAETSVHAAHVELGAIKKETVQLRVDLSNETTEAKAAAARLKVEQEKAGELQTQFRDEAEEAQLRLAAIASGHPIRPGLLKTVSNSWRNAQVIPARSITLDSKMFADSLRSYFENNFKWKVSGAVGWTTREYGVVIFNKWLSAPFVENGRPVPQGSPFETDPDGLADNLMVIDRELSLPDAMRLATIALALRGKLEKDSTLDGSTVRILISDAPATPCCTK